MGTNFEAVFLGMEFEVDHTVRTIMYSLYNFIQYVQSINWEQKSRQSVQSEWYSSEHENQGNLYSHFRMVFEAACWQKF